MINTSNTLFDLILFLIIFPSLFKYNCNFKIFKTAILIILIVHVWILYCRYLLNRECKFPVYFEIVAIILGLLFILDGYYTNTSIIILCGIIIIIGHVNKILYPELPYYF